MHGAFLPPLNHVSTSRQKGHQLGFALQEAMKGESMYEDGARREMPQADVTPRTRGVRTGQDLASSRGANASNVLDLIVIKKCIPLEKTIKKLCFPVSFRFLEGKR